MPSTQSDQRLTCYMQNDNILANPVAEQAYLCPACANPRRQIYSQ